jgi:predicted NodU family carbamoyl transferase
MKVLGINISHNASIALYANNKIKKYYEEDRFNKIKHWEPDLNNCFFKSLEKIKDFDKVIYSSYDKHDVRNFKNDKTIFLKHDIPIIKKIQKQLNNPDYFFNPNNHHVYHAVSSLYFSPFKEALSLVIDGGGAQSISTGYQEMESIFFITKNKINLLKQNQSNIRFMFWGGYYFIKEEYSNVKEHRKINEIDYCLSSSCGPGIQFDRASTIMKTDLPGKVMALSGYAYTDKHYNLNYDLVHMAKYVQEYSLDYSVSLIEEALKLKKCNNIVLSGGYFLNCINNFKLVKYFKNINFFVDPIPHDGGTAVGAAIYLSDY